MAQEYFRRKTICCRSLCCKVGKCERHHALANPWRRRKTKKAKRLNILALMRSERRVGLISLSYRDFMRFAHITDCDVLSTDNWVNKSFNARHWPSLANQVLLYS